MQFPPLMNLFQPASHVAWLALAVFSQPLQEAHAQAPKPNVVLILADDLGYGDVGAYGATDILTPSIDRLASEGVKLNSFYVSPSCGITRAMLLTGSYAPRISLNRNHTPSAITGIHDNEVTLGDLFRSAGYATGIFGKWHLGDQYQYRPLRHGFDEFYGVPYSNNMWPFHPRTAVSTNEDPRLTAARARAELTGYASSNSPFPPGEGFPNLPLYDGDTIVEFNTDQTAFGSLFFDKAIDFIERHRAEPFFAYIPLTAPHVPLHPSAAFLGTSGRDLYGDTVQELDYGVGRVLARLAELGIDQQTLVIFLSDNGPWLEYGIDGGSAGPLRGGKETEFEGGIRVPALVRWPGGLSGGRVIAEPLTGADILPTLAGLIGAAIPTDRVIDGTNAWQLLTGNVPSLSRQAIFSFSEGDFADINLGVVRSGNWKLHVSTTGTTVTPVALFNLASDLGETTDVKGSQPAIVSTLLALGSSIVNNIAANQRPLGYVTLNGEPFSETAGAGNLIAFEAEDYHLREARGGQNWQPVSLRHSSFDLSLQALPNSGTNRTANYETNSPHLAYRIIPEQAARYYVWVRARGASGDDDSLHIGLDGQPVSSGLYLTNFGSLWTWSSTRSGGQRAYVDIPGLGEHRLDVWMREDGIVIDKIVLTTDPAFEPEGKGLVESQQSTDALAVPATANDDGPYPVVEGGSVAAGLNVLSNDTDPRGDPLTAVLVSPPANAAQFVLRPDGTFTYVHDGSETSFDVFVYTANDVDGVSNAANVFISVANSNDAPTLTLLGAAQLELGVGDAFNDPGATASDEEDGDLTGAIVVGGDSVDTSAPGTFTVTYDVTDSGGASAPRLVRQVSVVDQHPPVITLIGAATVSVTRGTAYNDPGATALDPEEGDISARIVVGGDVIDVNTIGTYVITYDVTDSAGNAARQVTRTVRVVSTPPPPPPPSGGGGGSFGWFELLGLAFGLGTAGRIRLRNRSRSRSAT